MITHKIRSELQHNLPDFTRKVVLTGCVLGLSMAAMRAYSDRRDRQRLEGDRRSADGYRSYDLR